MKQRTFAASAWDRKGKVTRRERFLAEMDAVIPCGALKVGVRVCRHDVATRRRARRT
jgi:hypothetical protein